MNTNIYKCIYADLDIYWICTYSGSNDNPLKIMEKRYHLIRVVSEE